MNGSAVNSPRGRRPRAENLGWTVGVGRVHGSLFAASTGLDEASHVAEAAGTLKAQKRFFRSTDIRLRELLAILWADPRLQNFVETELAEVVNGPSPIEDLELLRKYLEGGGNKAELARTGYLSRPTLYSRLARLQERLGLSLTTRSLGHLSMSR